MSTSRSSIEEATVASVQDDSEKASTQTRAHADPPENANAK